MINEIYENLVNELPRNIEDLKKLPYVFWHGSASGDLRGGRYGLHVGTHQAAKEALEARIGVPADGKGWYGTRKYGETLLAGKRTLKKLGVHETGFNVDVPEDDFYIKEYPELIPSYSDKNPVSLDAKPIIMPVEIIGDMTNTPRNPHGDYMANSLMARQIRQGNAKRGYYYRNVGEDPGSISAVVPNKDHLEILPFDPPVVQERINHLSINEGFRDTLRTAAVSAGLGAAAVLGGQHMMKSKTPSDAPSSFVIDDTEKSDAGVGISKNVDSGASSFAREQLGEELPTIKRAAIRNGIQPGTEDFAILLAIRKAEGGRAGREFGVLHPRAVDTDLETQAAWAAATIMRNRERWEKAGRPDDFITFLGNRYAPINSENDPTGLNRNWVTNVKHWTARFLND